MKVKKLKKRIKFKLFYWWSLWQYYKFIASEENTDWDYGSIIQFLILKLTIMGIKIAKYGSSTEAYSHPMIREMWQTRKYLKQSIEITTYDYYEIEQIKKAFSLMSKNILKWWD